MPLLIWAPQCPAKRLHQEPVSLTRLGSTLEVLAGGEAHGLTLFPSHNDLVPVVSEVVDAGEAFRRAIVGERYKLIVDVRNGGRALFDLKSDPNELANVYRSEPAAARAAEERYQRWLDSAGRR